MYVLHPLALFPHHFIYILVSNDLLTRFGPYKRPNRQHHIFITRDQTRTENPVNDRVVQSTLEDNLATFGKYLNPDLNSTDSQELFGPYKRTMGPTLRVTSLSGFTYRTA